MTGEPKAVVLPVRLGASLGIAVGSLLVFLVTASVVLHAGGFILLDWLVAPVPPWLEATYGVSAMVWLVSQVALCAVLFLGWSCVWRCFSALEGRQRWDGPTAASALAIGLVLVAYVVSLSGILLCLYLAYAPAVAGLLVRTMRN